MLRPACGCREISATLQSYHYALPIVVHEPQTITYLVIAAKKQLTQTSDPTQPDPFSRPQYM